MKVKDITRIKETARQVHREARCRKYAAVIEKRVAAENIKKRAQPFHFCNSKGSCIYNNSVPKKPICVRGTSCSDWGAEVA